MKKLVPPEALTIIQTLRYLPDLKNVSRLNRREPTTVEFIFWTKLLKSDKTGFRFLRQKPIGRIIADFYCPKLALVIEVDGSSHLSRYCHDKERDKYLEVRGIRTVRFTNKQVLNNIDNLSKELDQILEQRRAELKIG